ncbi:hypothetical protein MASR2M48_08120 [Spirochaetota bacterium]
MRPTASSHQGYLYGWSETQAYGCISTPRSGGTNAYESERGGESQDVPAFTRRRDELGRERYLSLYGIDNDRFGFADLVINTERMTPERIADVVVAAIGGRQEHA